jgi:hypothetical protein
MVQISGHNGGRKSTVSGSTGVKVRAEGKWRAMCVDHTECQSDGKRKALINHGSPAFQTLRYLRCRQ